MDPGEADMLAWLALALIVLAIYGLVTLYAAFDRWAERQSHGTPLAKTIPTMLTIALLYEIFPLGHFNILLPISAILIALMADWSRFHLARDKDGQPKEDTEGAAADPHSASSKTHRAAGGADHA
jgi:outer membrane PBP1 activator LpoA protein